MCNCVWYFCTYPYGLSLNGWHALLCVANNLGHGVTITTHAIKRHLLIWMTTVRQPTKRRRSCVLTLKYTFICVYWWTRQRIHHTLIVVDRYLRLMGDKTIPDSAEPRLESFYPPFVAGIDLPHQGMVDSYSLGQSFCETDPCCAPFWILRVKGVRQSEDKSAGKISENNSTDMHGACVTNRYQRLLRDQQLIQTRSLWDVINYSYPKPLLIKPISDSGRQCLGSHLLTWIDFNPSMGNYSNVQ